MVATDAVGGTIDRWLWFHYDLANDVLYLRLATHPETPAFGEETEDGLILLRDSGSDEPLGLTVVSWWKRFGRGHLPDSLGELGREIEAGARRLAPRVGLEAPSPRAVAPT